MTPNCKGRAGVAIFAHRGAHGARAGPSTSGAGAAAGTGGPRENTVAAFAAARRLGADGVELDARLAADGTPVVHHDAVLPGGTPIAALDRGSLPPGVPTLHRALEACEGLAVNVELKHEAGGSDHGRELAKVVAGLVAALPGVVVSSFDAQSLSAVRGAAPGVPTGLLTDWRRDPKEALAEAVALGCRSLHPFVTLVDAGLVAEAASAGLALHVWTVNADADLVAMGALGVAAVITDRVGAAREILHGRTGPGSAPNGGQGGG